MVTSGGEGKLEEGGQKTEISSYKINQYQACDVQNDKYNEPCCMSYTKVVKRVSPKSSHHKEKI